MKHSFDAQQGLVIVRAELLGPTGTALLRLALDTGATDTLVNAGMLVSVGFDPASRPDRLQVTTGSGIEYVSKVVTRRIKSLGQERANFAVLSHTLPPSTGVDGLLGVDFFRGHALTIDFRSGHIVVD